MISNTRIFNGISVVAVLLCMMGPAVAAFDNSGCDNDENEFIVPELALCSTHVYNIGSMTNPTNDAQRQLMNDVVALKTTVITQQMYAQYEMLSNTVKRLKTQLQKEVLLAKLKVASGDTSGDNSYSYSSGTNDKNMYIAGVDNCDNKATTIEVFQCLRSNYNMIYNASNGGKNIILELRKQLAADYRIMAANKDSLSLTIDDKCKETGNLSSRTNFEECLASLNSGVRQGLEAAQDKQKKQNSNGMFGGV